MSKLMTLAALCLLLAAPAFAGRLDDRLAATEPCRELGPISETESVTLENATISILPETANLSIAGRIACRSGPNAILQSDASVRLEARAAVDLETCAATDAEVRLTDFGGSLGDLVAGLAEPLQQALLEDIAGAAEDACRDLFDAE